MYSLDTSRKFVADLVKNYEDTLRALSVFRRLTENLNKKFTVDAITKEVTRILVEELHLENCSIMLWDEKEEALILKAGAGPSYQSKRYSMDSRFRLGEGIAGLTAVNKRAILVQDVDKDPRFLHLDSSVKIGSILATPLFDGEDLIGVINMSHHEKRFFSRRFVEVFNIISQVVGLVIVFARFDEYLKKKVHEKTKDLKDSRAYLENLINNANDIILTITRDGSLSFINQKVEEIGYTPDSVCGRPYYSFTGQRIGLSTLRGILKQGKAIWSVEVGDSNGETREFSCNISTIRNHKGRITSFLVIARDITEQKKMEDSIAMMSRLTSLGEMSAGIAHELNNRLVPILSYSELLLRKKQDNEITSKLCSIHDSALGCRKIVNAMLDFARQRPPRKVLTNVNKIIEKTISIVNYSLSSSGIHLTKALSPSLPLVMADPNQLEQVLINLLNNAIHSMKRGGKLTIESYTFKGKIHVKMADTGHGIPERYIDKIFDPFFTTKDVGEGTGLGLSVSFGIIKTHGGDIFVRSREGEGTTFTIELPVAEKQDRKEEVDEQEAVQKAKNLKGNQSILVIDDEESILEVLKDILEMEGFEVDCALEASAAIKMIEKRKYDVILTDIRMPRIDGREFYKDIVKSMPHLKDRFIFITGDIIAYDLGGLRRFIQDTGCPYLSKPFRPNEVISIVRKVIER